MAQTIVSSITNPNFKPEKYVVSEPRFDIIGNKLVDDDKELEDKYADTNAKPICGRCVKQRKKNLNTKSVERGQKIYYQVWLDTQNLQQKTIFKQLVSKITTKKIRLISTLMISRFTIQ